MKALVQEGSGSADVLHIRDIDKPAVTEGRVLVRVRAASVNALDWHSVHGGLMLEIAGKVMRMKSESVRGVDVAGEVEAVGSGVTKFKPGDEVFGAAPASFAEYASAVERGLVHKPATLSFEQAAAIGVAGRTALQGLRDHGQVKPGQRVLIHGAGGGVGTFAVQIANALGAHVTAVTGPGNLETVGALKPDLLIDHTKEDVTRLPDRYDVILDVAATRSIGSMTKLLKPGGTFVQTGAAKGSWALVFGRILKIVLLRKLFGQRVIMFVAKPSNADLEVLKGMVESGKICPVIDRTYPLSEGREAVRYVGTGTAKAKVVITV